MLAVRGEPQETRRIVLARLPGPLDGPAALVADAVVAATPGAERPPPPDSQPTFGPARLASACRRERDRVLRVDRPLQLSTHRGDPGSSPARSPRRPCRAPPSATRCPSARPPSALLPWCSCRSLLVLDIDPPGGEIHRRSSLERSTASTPLLAELRSALAKGNGHRDGERVAAQRLRWPPPPDGPGQERECQTAPVRGRGSTDRGDNGRALAAAGRWSACPRRRSADAGG